MNGTDRQFSEFISEEKIHSKNGHNIISSPGNCDESFDIEDVSIAFKQGSCVYKLVSGE